MFKILNKTIRKNFSNYGQLVGLSEEHVMISNVARQFAEQNFLPYANKWDEESYFPIDKIKQTAELGFGGIYVDEQYGGSGLGRFEGALIFENLSYGCISTAAYISIHNMVNGMINNYGNEEQKQKYCSQLSNFDMLSSYCLTEPNSGSDAQSMKTIAKQDGDYYIINGSKCFISGAGVSDLYLVMCLSGEKEISAFLIEKNIDGLSFGKNEKKMGWKSQPTATVNFDNVKIHKNNLLGQKGHGFKYALQGLNGGRVNIASCSVGGAEYVLDRTINYVQERKQFGKQISSFQNTQFKISEMATKIMTSKLLNRLAAQSLDENSDQKISLASMSKLEATERCFEVVDEGLQLFGGYGYLHEYDIERVLRDLRVHKILEGTNEIMRLLISRTLFQNKNQQILYQRKLFKFNNIMKIILYSLLFTISFSLRNLHLFGNSTLGYYYLEAYVGSNHQKKALIVDTGSHMTIFPCKGCQKCRSHLNQIYDPNQSKTFEYLKPRQNYFDWICSNSFLKSKCSFDQGYTEGSEYKGYYAVDEFRFQNELKEHQDKNYKHIFGCANRETGEFYSQEVDGIVGFGVQRQDLDNTPPTLIDIEKSENRLQNMILSFCIAHNGGEITLGDWNSKLHIQNTQINWINTQPVLWKKQYMVPLTNIKIGSNNVQYKFSKLQEDGGKAFIDSGTTYVYFDTHLYNAFVQGITNHCEKDENNCANNNSYQECYFWNKFIYPNKIDFLNTFPQIDFDFNGSILNWYPQDYMVPPSETSNHLCIGVKSLKNAILGAILMRNYDFYIDRSNKKIGFARANCGQVNNFFENYPKKMTDQFKLTKNIHKKKLKKLLKKKSKKKHKNKKKLSKLKQEINDPDFQYKVQQHSQQPNIKKIVQQQIQDSLIDNQDIENQKHQYQ